MWPYSVNVWSDAFGSESCSLVLTVEMHFANDVDSYPMDDLLGNSLQESSSAMKPKNRRFLHSSEIRSLKAYLVTGTLLFMIEFSVSAIPNVIMIFGKLTFVTGLHILFDPYQ